MTSSCAPSELRRARPLLGTLVEISVRGASTATLGVAVEAAFVEGQAIHGLMSFHEAASDVSRLNRCALAGPVEVDPRTWQVLDRAREIAAASDGAFDPTVAATLVDWGFLPQPDAVPARRARGMHHVELLPGQRVRFRAPVWIDLGGIAKGFAVDRMCEALEAHGVCEYVVNAGGDLRVGARSERVYARDPDDPVALVPLAELAGMAVATSGRYFAEQRSPDGALRHPIVAPDTRLPAAFSGSVSVMSSDCMTADALTKPVALLGGRARPLLRRFGAEARWLGAGATVLA